MDNKKVDEDASQGGMVLQEEGKMAPASKLATVRTLRSAVNEFWNAEELF